MGWFDRLFRSADASHRRPGVRGGIRGHGMEAYNFTERARTVLALARDEAAALDHEYVGTEHLLLGLIREGEGVGAAVIGNLASGEVVRTKLLAALPRGAPPGPTGPTLPYTSRAKRALELATAEAREFDHTYVGTEHLLLGLVREERGIAAQVLVDSGVSLEAARAETLRLLRGGPPTPDAAA